MLTYVTYGRFMLYVMVVCLQIVWVDCPAYKEKREVR